MAEAPPSRPAHPLFGGAGGGMKNELFAAAAKRNQKTVEDPRPSRSVAGGDGAGGGGAPPPRPPNPMMGGGGGHANALQAAIAARAAKSSGGGEPPAPAPFAARKAPPPAPKAPPRFTPKPPPKAPPKPPPQDASDPPSSSPVTERPPHPLMANGGKSALNAAIMSKAARASDGLGPPEPPSRLVPAALPAGRPPAPGGDDSTPMTSRPPHPLMANGGKSALNAAILAKGGKSNNDDPDAAPKFRQPDAVAKPLPKPPKTSAPMSISDQAVMMAMKRKQRVGDGDENMSPPPRQVQETKTPIFMQAKLRSRSQDTAPPPPESKSNPLLSPAILKKTSGGVDMYAAPEQDTYDRQQQMDNSGQPPASGSPPHSPVSTKGQQQSPVPPSPLAAPPVPRSPLAAPPVPHSPAQSTSQRQLTIEQHENNNIPEAAPPLVMSRGMENAGVKPAPPEEHPPQYERKLVSKEEPHMVTQHRVISNDPEYGKSTIKLEKPYVGVALTNGRLL